MFRRRWSASCIIAWRKTPRRASIPPATLRLISNISPDFRAAEPGQRWLAVALAVASEKRSRGAGFCWRLRPVSLSHARCTGLVGGAAKPAPARLRPSTSRSRSAPAPSAMRGLRPTAASSTAHPGRAATTSFICRARRIRARADWSANGDSLAVVRYVPENNHWRLEYPAGKVLLDGINWISHPKISPDGKWIAFADHENPGGDDEGSLAVIGADGREKERKLSSGWTSLQGILWSPSGDEIWF